MSQDPRLLIAWYGDDFTGAAAVMEVLAFAGLRSMLFLDVPTPAQLDRYRDLRAIGIASTARAQSPKWMDKNLPAVFARLAALGPELLHYKICSTLDSSPTTGSIGRAIELGTASLGTSVVPMVVAAPKMQRYQCFGHLFAGVGDDVVRLDRHPVMAQHPVTPMSESDVARHVTRQSDRIDGRFLSLTALASGEAVLPETSGEKGRIELVTIDSINAETDAAAGCAIWNQRANRRFVVGSQGIEYALVEHWRQSGMLEETGLPSGIGRSKGMVTVSGSVSPTTARQIGWAKDNGFASIEFDATQVCGGEAEIHAEIARTTTRALAALSQGLDPLIHTAEGPDDPAVARFLQAISTTGIDSAQANRRIGEALGHVLRSVLEQTDVRRAIVSGGDTSGYATQQLGIFALSALAPTIPGASIFCAHADGPMDGLELALKGGQMGSPDYFGWVREGGGVQ